MHCIVNGQYQSIDSYLNNKSTFKTAVLNRHITENHNSSVGRELGQSLEDPGIEPRIGLHVNCNAFLRVLKHAYLLSCFLALDNELLLSPILY